MSVAAFMLPSYVKDFDSLCKFLTSEKIEKVYLSHSAEQEGATRDFAQKLRNRGFIPMVAADYRKRGREAVSKAISESQFCLVCAFTDDEQHHFKKHGISFVDLG